MNYKIYRYLLAAFFVLSLSSCLSQRTVKDGDHTISQEYIIKRPLKEVIKNSR